MGKLPASLFYWGDWARDLEEYSLEVEGAWIRICCKLSFAEPRGTLSRTVVQWAKILRETPEKTLLVLQVIQGAKIGDVSPDLQDVSIVSEFNNTMVTITSRRMQRDSEVMEGNRKRQAIFREKGGGDPDRWIAIRVTILKRDGYTCAYCGRKGYTVDHIIPRSNGGGETWGNLVCCCKSCNSKKNNGTMEERGMSFWVDFDKSKLNNNNLITIQKQVNNTLTRVRAETETENESLEIGTGSGSLETEVLEKEKAVMIEEIINYLNLKTGKHYKLTTPKTMDFISLRMAEGFSVQNFKTVIDKKTADWKKDPKMEQYLRPETLFGTKFEGYLNQEDGGGNGTNKAGGLQAADGKYAKAAADNARELAEDKL